MLCQANRQALHQPLGHRGTLLLAIAIGVFGTPAFECVNTSVAHIYKYHQRDEHLFYGMPYSNFWFGAMMMALPQWALDQADTLVMLIPRTSLSLWRQRLLACGVGFSVVISTFFVAATVNGVWYALAGDIWTPTPRSF
jgi:hypothetical protein